MEYIDNLNVQAQEVLLTPEQLKQRLPITEENASRVAESRQVI